MCRLPDGHDTWHKNTLCCLISFLPLPILQECKYQWLGYHYGQADHHPHYPPPPRPKAVGSSSGGLADGKLQHSRLTRWSYQLSIYQSEVLIHHPQASAGTIAAYCFHLPSAQQRRNPHRRRESSMAQEGNMSRCCNAPFLAETIDLRFLPCCSL